MKALEWHCVHLNVNKAGKNFETTNENWKKQQLYFTFIYFNGSCDIMLPTSGLYKKLHGCLQIKTFCSIWKDNKSYRSPNWPVAKADVSSLSTKTYCGNKVPSKLILLTMRQDCSLPILGVFSTWVNWRSFKSNILIEVYKVLDQEHLKTLVEFFLVILSMFFRFCLVY